MTVRANPTSSTSFQPVNKLDAGTDPNRPTLVAIKGIVFDVTRNQAYSPTGQYRGAYSPSIHSSISACGVLSGR